MTEVTKAKLKPGSEVNYWKNDGKHFFFKNMVALSNFQVMLMLFIILASILMNVVLLSHMTDGFNKIIGDINGLRQELIQNNALQEDTITLYPTNEP